MTLTEWRMYIESLTGSEVRSKAIAANSQRFVDLLRAEGRSMDEVRVILEFFVLRMLACGQKIPMGGAFDLLGMARRFEALNGPVEPIPEEVAATPAEGRITPQDGLETALAGMVEG